MFESPTKTRVRSLASGNGGDQGSPPQVGDLLSPSAMATRRSPRIPMSPSTKMFLSLPANVALVPAGATILASGTKPEGKPRTHNEIVKDRIHDVPGGWPHGPWESRRDARDAFNAHFQPRFTVTLNSFKAGNSKSGAKVFLYCHRQGKPRAAIGVERSRGGFGVGCKWKITLEESLDGWVVSKLNNLEHTHELVASRSEALAHASLRSIPEDFYAFGSFLKQAGMAPTEILKYVVENSHNYCL